MSTRLLRLLLSLAVCASLLCATGCATHDSRDAPWDPRGHNQLMDQTPAWEGAAGKICCGHLRECKSYQSPRC